MSKWSAEDVTFKYFWLFALDPILYKEEKEIILYFLCNYINKKLILPDEVMKMLLDHKVNNPDNIIKEMTDNYRKNWVTIQGNWFQGNLNYTSSYVHTVSMRIFKDIIFESAKRLEGKCFTTSMVHSDDNQTSVLFLQNKLSMIDMGKFLCTVFKNSLIATGNQLNTKKTYVTNYIKEFVSLFNLGGEPFSIFGRFLLPTVGDCAYIGPYEDLASRLSGTQSAVKHGCQPSIAWVSIAMNSWITYSTYNMLPGQKNDPCRCLKIENRREIPIELGGLLHAPLDVIAVLGTSAHSLWFLYKILNKVGLITQLNESVQAQAVNIKSWNIDALSETEIFILKVMRYLHLETDMDTDAKLGETSDMRKKSILTPRKFTTARLIRKLQSYKDFYAESRLEETEQELLKFVIKHPELLVTKAETAEEYMTITKFRYYSKKFKESLSIQNPSQLFIEQILFSNKPTIEYNSVRARYTTEYLTTIDSETPVGNVTICQALWQIKEDMSNYKFDNSDLDVVFKFCCLNDPIMVAMINAELLHVKTSQYKKTDFFCNSMPEFKNIKIVEHSPAVVIKKYIYGDRYNAEVLDPIQLDRDVKYLSNFIDELKLEEHMKKSIADNESVRGCKDLRFELMELTKFYQTCYDYIKSTEHKVKILIMTKKTYNAVEFCAVLKGSLRSDKFITNIYFKGPILTFTPKGEILSYTDQSAITGEQVMNMIVYFIDTFIENIQKTTVLNRLLDEYTFEGRPLRELLDAVLDSSRIQSILPLAFKLAPNEKVIKLINDKRASGAPTWNNWQTNRHLNTGPIDLTISNIKGRITIKGLDSEIKFVEFVSFVRNPRTEATTGDLLRAKHRLKIQSMKPILDQDIERGKYYLTFKKQGRDYRYQIMLGKFILERNSSSLGHPQYINRKITAVCIAVIAHDRQTIDLTYADLVGLNIDNDSIGSLEIGDSKKLRMKRSYFQKMAMLDGPDIIMSGISFNKLCKSQILLVQNFESLLQCNMSDIAEVMQCDGKVKATEEVLFSFMSDEQMIEEVKEDIEMQPIVTVKTYRIAGSKKSYRDGLKQIIYRDSKIIESAFKRRQELDLSDRKNLGYMNLIKQILEIIKEQCGKTLAIQDLIHLLYITNGLDSTYHKWTDPGFFMKQSLPDIIYDTVKMKRVLKDINIMIPEPWRTYINEFIAEAWTCIEEMEEKYRKMELKDEDIDYSDYAGDQSTELFSFF